MTKKNEYGQVPDRSYMKLLYETYGQQAVDKYLEKFTIEDDDLGNDKKEE